VVEAVSDRPPWPRVPPPTSWRLPDAGSLPAALDGEDLVALGADLEPGTLLTAYAQGLFPMGVERELGWWSPDPRGVLPLSDLVVSRSLRAARRRFRVTVDTAFGDVVDGCAHPDVRRDGGGRWITPDFVAAYCRLHDLGWAHSIEVWDDEGGLAGGLYGVAVRGLFAGESMFHRRRDASKVALVALVRLLAGDGVHRLLDVQWLTPHLQSLGATEVPRLSYWRLLQRALALPLPEVFARPSGGLVIEP
jgi:leucyl/phenylalanyl-tRNA--protein transferase